MKQENLDELKNIYLGLVTGGEGPEVLNEAPKLTPFELSVRDTFSGKKLRDGLSYTQTPEFKKSFRAGTPGNTSGTPVQNPVKAAEPYKSKFARPKNAAPGIGNFTDKDSRLDSPIAGKGPKGNEVGSNLSPFKPPVNAGSSGNGSSGNGSSGNGSSGPTRPVASGPVLSKLKGVEGTGVGANFKAKAFTDTEKTRYSSVAAAKPAIPTGTTAGGTTFQRRAATGDELRAAQDARAAAKAAGDTKGAEEAAVKAGVNASKPSTPTPNPVKANVPGFALGGKPTPPTPAAAEPSGETDRLKKALDIKKSDVTSSYQFPMYKTLRDLSDSYNEIYEAKKKLDLVGQEDDDIDNDGDTDKSDKYLLNRRKVRSKAIGEATAMSKRGLDEPAIRNQIASKTRGGSFADKATALADKETYGDKKKKEGREKLARKQRGDFRDTTSSSPGLRGYGHQSSDPAVKAKQDARGNQRARAALTPNERKQLNMEYDLYDLIQSHLLEYGFADTEEGANMIIENMSPSWIKQILSED